MELQVYRFFAWLFGISFWVMFALANVGFNQRDELRSKALTCTGAEGSRITLERIQVGRRDAE